MKKHCAAKVLLAISEIFLHENNRNYNSYRFNYKFAFILCLPFFANQKQESSFQQVGDLVKRNISVFFLFIDGRVNLMRFNELREKWRTTEQHLFSQIL